MDRNTYMKQHKEISTEIEKIQLLLAENNLEKNVEEIALHICTLAGKINVHLSMEDKFMYPKMITSEDEQIKKLALRYQQQMGGIAERFTSYKDKYNTKQKIMEHYGEIKAETQKMFHEILNRVSKEESELYLHIQ